METELKKKRKDIGGELGTQSSIDTSFQSLKRNVRIMLLLLICSLLFSFVLLYEIVQLGKNAEVAQEQINFIQDKTKTIQDDLYQIGNKQTKLNERMVHHEFTHAVDQEKEPEIEQLIPFDHIKEDEIRVAGEWFTIQNRDLNWAKYLDTGSMEPTISSSMNGIEIVPKSTADIHIGDIVSYSYDDFLIVHRVTKIGMDEEEWYAITKGDNLEREDSSKVRFDQIQGVLIGIIY